MRTRILTALVADGSRVSFAPSALDFLKRGFRLRGREDGEGASETACRSSTPSDGLEAFDFLGGWRGRD
ncbi:hypothetical protein ACSBOB_11315 [Mesorhizobium sp. ASY16-5R]|uniref:hypothetical protein n=1 Tax=Mesorhizobium sp. ASY16-5R TaxID=3445772 RepID=UPI003FA14DA8